MSRSLWILVLLVVAGCSTVPERLPSMPAEEAWSTRQARIRQLDHWMVSGRIAVRDGNESWHANILWEQTPERYAISVIAPLGGGTFQLEGDRRRVVLRTPEDGVYVAGDPDSLMAEVLGLQIPVSGMRYWILGIPHPGAATEYDLDPWGRLKMLRQSKWVVDFLRYRESGEHELPDKVFMRNDRFEVRLVVSEWSMETRSSAVLIRKSHE